MQELFGCELLRHLTLSYDQLDQEFTIESREYLADSLERLHPMRDDGLVDLTSNAIRITDKGRLLVRNACMAFDTYLQHHEQQRFSKAI